MKNRTNNTFGIGERISLLGTTKLAALSAVLLLGVFCTIGMSFTPAEEGENVGDPNDSTYVTGPKRSHWTSTGSGCTGGTTHHNITDYGKVTAVVAEGSGTLSAEGGNETHGESFDSSTRTLTVTWNTNCGNEGVDNTGQKEELTNAHSNTVEFTATPDEGFAFEGWYSDADCEDRLSEENPYTDTYSIPGAEYGTEQNEEYEKASTPYDAGTIYAKFVEIPKVDLTFLAPGDKGTVSVTIGEETTQVTGTNVEKENVQAEVSLLATPAEGYVFVGWYTIDESGVVTERTTDVTYTNTFSSNCSIAAHFVPTTTAIFRNITTSTDYYGLRLALKSAKSGEKIIPVVDCTVDGTDLIPGTNAYTIPSGVTLLVPNSTENTVSTNEPVIYEGTGTAPTPFRTLTLESAVHITVNGSICVNAVLRNSQNSNGAQHGQCGMINMNEGSTITLNNAANLYCWGVIYGAGEITANSGATVYESFQVNDYPGGRIMAPKIPVLNPDGKYDEFINHRVFPIRIFCFPNIQSKLHIHYGATEKVATAFASLGLQKDIVFISDGKGLFTLSKKGTYITKWYDINEDLQHFELRGEANLKSVQFTAGVDPFTADVNSANYILPIPHNMRIDLLPAKEGEKATVNITENLAILPGAKISVGKNVTAKIAENKASYIYDLDQWENNYTYAAIATNAASNKNNFSIIYGRDAANKRSFLKKDLSDAVLEVAGTIEVNGALYTTESGADIKGVDGGKVIFATQPPQTLPKVYQFIQSDITYPEIPITPAWLHNGEEWYSNGLNAEYLATEGVTASTTIEYANDHWGWMEIWKKDGETILKISNTCTQVNNSAAFDGSLSKEGHTLSWTTTVNTANQEVIHTAQWTVNNYTLTWDLDGGTITTEGTTAGSVAYGTELTAPTVTKAGYTFTGWSPTVAATMPADNVEYIAQWTVNNYTLTWNLDGGTITTEGTTAGSVAYGTELTAPTVTKAGYTFTGWSPTVAATMPAENVEYIAQWTVNNYTLTWDLDGGTITTEGTTAGSVAYGTELTAPIVTKAGYTFVGWSPELATTMPAENVTYTAQWTFAQVGDPLDIVDADGTNLTINANGWASSGWPYTVSVVTTTTNTNSYEKTARQSDRTLKVPYSGDLNADMQIIVTNTSGTVSNHIYKVPFVYTGTENMDAMNENSIVFVKSGTLQTTDGAKAKEIYVADSAELEVTGKLTVGKLVLRTTPYKAAVLTIETDGSIALADGGQVFYSRIAPNKSTIKDLHGDTTTYNSARYYQFGLPLSCPISSVTMSNAGKLGGSQPKYGTAWMLKSYSESSRAENGISNEGANWSLLPSEGTITAGVGYEMFSNSNYYREFYFPVDLTTATDTVSVQYTEGTKEEHNGWNIITSPLTSRANVPIIDPATAIKPCWLLADGSYTQEIPEIIPPAVPFAYQTSTADTLNFVVSTAAAAPRRQSAAEAATETEWVHLDINNAEGRGDETSIFVHPTRFEQDYKPGIDVAKQSLTASRAILYTAHAYGNMAFAGVADTLLENGIDVIVYSPTEQQLTFSLRENAFLNRLEYLWLADNKTGARTDLLLNDYTFRAAAGTDKQRFVLNGRFKAPQITTNITNTVVGYNIYAIGNNIAISGVEQGTPIYVFDAVGHMIYTTAATSDEVIVPAPCAGVYMLSVGGQTAKLVINQ